MTSMHYIVGLGEIGNSLFDVLSVHYPTKGVDLSFGRHTDNWDEASGKFGIDFLHICIRHSGSFDQVVFDYVEKMLPNYVVIHSTVPVGTTEKLRLNNAVHSPNRGLHPNLAESMRTFVKHIGGPKAHVVAECFEKVGIRTKCHSRSSTTEAQHLIRNSFYGVYIMFAEEAYQLCRKYGLDYHEVVTQYGETHNDGYKKLGHESKIHPLVYPTMGNGIGGHCLVLNAQLIPEGDRGPILNMLAHFNDGK